MKKLFFILPVLAVLLLLSCSVRGVEAGLLGTWKITSGELENNTGDFDLEGTFVVNCDDTFTMDYTIEGTISGSNVDSKIVSKGIISANYSAKTFELKYDEYKANGKKQSIDEYEGTYNLNCANLTLVIDAGNADLTLTCSRW